MEGLLLIFFDRDVAGTTDSFPLPPAVRRLSHFSPDIGFSKTAAVFVVLDVGMAPC